jgi:hypothetical protein
MGISLLRETDRMKARLVRVDIRSEVLRGVLVEQMRAFPGLDLSSDDRVDIVLSTTADVKPADCAKLTADGTDVVILATVPNGEQGEGYEAAGARYVPMSGHQKELLTLLDSLQVRS